jgi:protein SCO1/2
MSSRTFLFLGIAAGLIIAVVAAGLVFQEPYQYQGSILQPPVPAADFTLVDQNEESFRLSDQQGRVVLIFFGYTNCPMLPGNHRHGKIHTGLGEQAIRSVLYITVDPQRDTPERIKDFKS